jgi:5-methylcytosine-specific restriction endonuclease McrA
VSASYVAKELRAQVSEEARYRCGYCLSQERVVGTLMEMDHLLPVALGGETVAGNLWLSCSGCNAHKGARVGATDSEVTAEIVRLFNPRRDRWSEHFAWTTDGERIVGTTPVGRATVVTLQLNRPSLVLSRREWVRVGWHPPSDTVVPPR